MADKETLGRRLRATLDVLANSGAPMTRSAVWAATKAGIPLAGDDSESNSDGTPRGETNWAFATTDMSKAGWLTKGRNAWEITDEGREVLARLTDPVELVTESRRLYASWKVGQAKQFERSLSERLLPVDEGQSRVIEGARTYVERALILGESVFAPGRQLWTENVAAELETHFVGAESIPGKSFMEQIAIQLAGASDDARLLMAELVALQLLPASTDAIGEQAKRARVNGVLRLMEHPVIIPAEIDSVFPFGSFNPGTRMLTNLGAAMTIVVSFALAWTRTAEAEREELLYDPWRFREWMLTVPGEGFPSQRHSLEYLVHPDAFISIVSNEHKRLIRDAFIGEIGDSTDDLDRDLLAITTALQVKYHGPVRYYGDELRSIWQKTVVKPAVAPEPVTPADGEDSAGEPTATPTPRTPFATADEKLAASVLSDTSWLQGVLGLLWRQRQVIFYGPPGTGKTFLARALAKHISEGADPVIVQFHPSYAYEDFVEGYRPVVKEGNTLVYELVLGPFLEIARDAARNPELNYVLVIDEINRGNIAKVFGELYFLLEYRDEKIKLLYRAEHFALPENVYIVGTMNTADRSIALLDAAMRRRFAFVELHPDEKPTSDLLGRWLNERNLDSRPAALLTTLNAAISHRDARIGPSYFMPDDGDLSEARLREIWKYQLLPLLEEAHYGDGLDVESRFGFETISRRVESQTAVRQTSEAHGATSEFAEN